MQKYTLYFGWDRCKTEGTIVVCAGVLRKKNRKQQATNTANDYFEFKLCATGSHFAYRATTITLCENAYDLALPPSETSISRQNVEQYINNINSLLLCCTHQSCNVHAISFAYVSWITYNCCIIPMSWENFRMQENASCVLVCLFVCWLYGFQHSPWMCG